MTALSASTATTATDELVRRATDEPPPRPKARAGPLEWIVIHLTFLVVAAFFLVPFLWLLSAAFDEKASAYIQLPVEPTLMNFVRIFTEHDFARVLANSVFVAVATMILVVFTVALAGYSLSRIELRRKDWITYAVLLLQTMPISATMVPIYGLARQLGLRNSYVGLILIHAAIELPFLIWLMKGFFDSIPRHLEEAAWLDGRSKFRALIEIVLPLARPGLGIAAGLAFLSAWAEVLMVVILIDQDSLKTVPLAFYEAMRTQGGYTEVEYGVIAAMAIIYLLPVMAVFFASRRLMVRGLMNSTRGL
ncbi:MAG: multiple sugar transport system permease protein [Chloroflexota bacterium]|jgi:multiple sugar transport system permease protein|nr:multiple sugar transport system permease protein [Chloroflexota bacterium]